MASKSVGGFGSLRSAAESVARGCAMTAGAGLPPLIAPEGAQWGFALWLRASRRPVVYSESRFVTDRAGTNITTGVFSSSGLRVSLGNAWPVALWPCQEPVAFYLLNRTLWMQGRGKPVSLGRVPVNPVFDSQGRLAGPPRSPLPGWRVARFAPSPQQPLVVRKPAVFLAEVEKPGCTSTADGRLYVISPSGSTPIAAYSACDNPPLAGWSPDGSKFFWTSYSGAHGLTQIHVSDSSGGHSRRVATVDGQVLYALWSPDGKTIAYTYQRGLDQVAVVRVATGTVRTLTHVHWKPPPPPNQPPAAAVVGWSPTGKTVLIFSAATNSGRTTIEAIPATGGRPRILIQLKS